VLVDRVAALTKDTGSGFAGLALLVIWDLASGKDGTVRGLSVSRLAELMGCDRKTARAAILVLIKHDLLRTVKDAPRQGRVPVYMLDHCTKDEGDE
jgi:hypothetical protein